MSGNLSSLFYKYPPGFPVEETQRWLASIPEVASWRELEQLLTITGTWKKEDFRAFSMLMHQKYLNFSDVETWPAEIEWSKRLNSAIRLSFSKERLLDFGKVVELKQCVVRWARNCDEISLPIQGELESLCIEGASKLTSIHRLEAQLGLKMLAIRKCNKLENFTSIAQLHQLQYLDLSGNKKLTSIDFLAEHPSLMMLELTETTVVKSGNISEVLKSMPQLKYLNIAANKKERQALRAALGAEIIL